MGSMLVTSQNTEMVLELGGDDTICAGQPQRRRVARIVRSTSSQDSAPRIKERGKESKFIV